MQGCNDTLRLLAGKRTCSRRISSKSRVERGAVDGCWQVEEMKGMETVGQGCQGRDKDTGTAREDSGRGLWRYRLSCVIFSLAHPWRNVEHDAALGTGSGAYTQRSYAHLHVNMHACISIVVWICAGSGGMGRICMCWQCMWSCVHMDRKTRT